MKKTILILNESRLNEIFTEAFIKDGYEVISILKEPFVYKKNIWTKLMNIYYRLVLKKNSFYGENYYEKLNQEVNKRLKKIKKKVDYSLVFRADYYSKKNIQILREKSNLLISYQYDGWELGKGIVNHKEYLDRVFFFEKDDISKFGEKALPLTNCYFQETIQNTVPILYDVYYIGTATKPRIKFIENLYHRLHENFKITGLITIPQYQKESQIGDIQLSHKGLDYTENIALLQKSRCLVDIRFTYHKGLSFRFFEALYYKKKLITNNESVKNYDFYHPNNIFITDFENLDGIEDFLNKPYVEIDEKIVNKYGFKNWSRYVLDLPDHQKISLP